MLYFKYDIRIEMICSFREHQCITLTTTIVKKKGVNFIKRGKF